MKLTSNGSIVSKKTESKIISALAALGVFFFLLLLANCGFYYKVREIDDLSDPDTQAKLNLKGKYVILRQGTLAKNFYLINIDQDIMSGNLRSLSFDHQLNLNPKKQGGNRYKIRREGDVVNEVHIHLADDSFDLLKTSISFPLSSIQKVQVYSRDRAATSLSWILPPVLVIGAIAGIVAASSCPFVYTFDGISYNLAGEIYGGATYPSLERHDYLPLNEFKPHKGSYKLKIANELREIQHTNLCELLAVEHLSSLSVILDKKGKPQTFSKIELPKRAITTNGSDVTFSLLQKADYQEFAFDDEGENHHVNGVILTFINTNKSKTGKLIIRAKNSAWADYAYGRFTTLFGSYYEDWERDQKKLSTREMRRNAIDQDIPLTVFIETKKGWEFIDYFEVVGPIAFREMVLPVDLSKTDLGIIKIKLETGYKFWDLDYAAMDFGSKGKCKISKLPLLSAVDETGKNVKALIEKDDKEYLVQPETGNEVVLEFGSKDKSLSVTGKTISIFLHSKGYYERIRQYDHSPNWITLVAHKHKHAFSKYSFAEYQKARERQLTATSN